jgi:hypothetical protein
VYFAARTAGLSFDGRIDDDAEWSTNMQTEELLPFGVMLYYLQHPLKTVDRAESSMR